MIRIPILPVILILIGSSFMAMIPLSSEGSSDASMDIEDPPGSSSGSYIEIMENIMIDGDSELADNSTSGTGTENDPYILSGWDMNEYNLNISNTTKYFALTDIKWVDFDSTLTTSGYSDSRLYFYNNDHIRFQNFSIESDYQIWGQDCDDLRIIDSWFNVSLGSQNVVSIQYSGLKNVSIIRSHFITSTTQFNQIANIILNSDQGNLHVKDSNFSRTHFQPFIKGIQIIEGCDFIYAGRITPRHMMYGSEIRNNVFNWIQGPAGMSIFIVRNLNIWNTCNIHNNSFISISGTGNTGIYISSTDAPRDNIVIKDNVFQKVLRGILIYGNAHVVIHSNEFISCSNVAMQVGGDNITVWKNFFINNRQYSSGPQVQVNNFGSNMKFDFGGIGNYWNDHLGPDENGDGFVDSAYNLTSTFFDNFPVTNIYFDLEKPKATFTAIQSGFLERSYCRFGWEASDIYGIRSIYLDGEIFQDVNVTNLDVMSIFLEKGEYHYTLKVYDNNGLFRIVPLDLILNETFPVLKIIDPADESYVDNYPTEVKWEIADYFPVENINLTMDGDWMHPSNTTRSRKYNLEEGYHTICIEISDDLNVTCEDHLDFHVDYNCPTIDLVGPLSGTVLSSRYVTFQCDVSDEVGLDQTLYRLNGIDWIELDEGKIQSELLDEGDHKFQIAAKDLAGHITSHDVPFSISYEDLVTVNSPQNGTYFNTRTLDLEWEYEGLLDWTEAYLKVGRRNDFVKIPGNGIHTMEFVEEGEYEIILKLVDDLGNYVSSDISVIKDTKDPVVGFAGIEDGDFLNDPDLDLTWMGYDECCIDRYQLAIDDGPWKEMGDLTMKKLELGEGDHVLSVRIFDMAGNMEMSTISVNIDLTDPTISFDEPETNVFTSNQVEVKWECSDACGIASMYLDVQGKDPVDVLLKTRYVTTISADGEYLISLNATDIAGNTATISRTITVDITEPRLTWTMDPVIISNNRSFSLDWELIEEMGVQDLYLLINGNRTEVDIDSTSIDLELEDGSYGIELVVVDIAGWEYILEYPDVLIVDTTPPELSILSTSVSESGSGIMIWETVDLTTDIDIEIISIDGANPIEIEGSYFETGSLEAGDHVVKLTIIDSAGNIIDETWTFTVEDQEDDTSDDGGSRIIIMIIIILAALLILSILGIFLFFRSRKQGEKEASPLSLDIRKIDEDEGLKAAPAADINHLNHDEKAGLPPAATPSASTIDDEEKKES